MKKKQTNEISCRFSGIYRVMVQAHEENCLDKQEFEHTSYWRHVITPRTLDILHEKAAVDDMIFIFKEPFLCPFGHTPSVDQNGRTTPPSIIHIRYLS